MAQPSLKYQTVAVAIAVAIGAVDAAADIRSGVDCLELRPLHVDSGELLCGNLVDLGCDGGQHAVDIAHNLASLSCVVGSAAELADGIGLASDGGLHFALLEVTELVVDHRGLSGNSCCDGCSVAVSLTGQSVGLLDGADLGLVALLHGEKLLLAACEKPRPERLRHS